MSHGFPMSWLRILAALGVLASAAAAPGSASAQDYPVRPVRLVVPQSPGGVTDVIARAVAQRLAETWGQPVVVENKPGANYQIGATSVAKAEPDGYTLLVMSEAFVINPLMSGKLPYDPAKDFAPITGLISINHALVVHPSLSANSVQDLIALAKTKPSEINYATYGLGSTGHLNMEMLQSAAAIRLFPIHYKGATPALTDVIAGHVPLMFISVASVLEPWRAGKLKLLAVGSPQRLRTLPEVPTLAESGLPNFRALTWFGLFTTGGTPPAVVARINGDVQRIVAEPSFHEKFLAPQLFDPMTSTSAQFADFLKAETQKWGKVIRDANIKVD
jgi:tripartite-type tricarboxylate transporter receptor subunit TctC